MKATVLFAFEFSRRHLGGAWLALPGAELPTLLIRGRVVAGSIAPANATESAFGAWVWSAAGRHGCSDRYSTARAEVERSTS